MTDKSKNEIIQDAFEEIITACKNIKKDLQANEIKLIDLDILTLADMFFEELKVQNSKIIITGDGQ